MASSIYLIKGVFPAHNEIGVALNARIVVQFSESMDPLSLNPGTVRLKQINGPLVPCAYAYTPASSESKEKLLYLTPDAPFTPGVQYQVEVMGGTAGIKSIIGTTLTVTKTYDFTAKNIVLPKAPDGLVLKVENQKLTATWNSVENATSYGVKLSTSNDPLQAGLVPAIGETTTSALTMSFAEVLKEGQHYVHLYANADVKSPWTTAQVYVEAPAVVAPTPTLPSYNLRLIESYPAEGSFEQDPQQIGFAFDQPVLRDEAVGRITLRQKGVSKLSGVNAGVALELLPEDTESPEVLLFDVSTPLLQDTSYVLTLPKDLSSIDGQKLGVSKVIEFTMKSTHFYGEIQGVRAEVGEIGSKISDAEIAKLMRRYSETVYRLHEGYRSFDLTAYDGKYPFYVGKIVELETASSILTTAVLNYSVNSDRTISLADLDVGERSRQVFGMNELLSAIRAKIKPFEDLLHGYSERGYASMDFVVRGDISSPYPEFIGTRSDYKEIGE